MVLLVLAWRKRGRVRRGEIEESRESMLTPELLLEQWRNIWRRRPKAAAQEAFLSLQDDESTRQAVRRIYRQLLALARRWGRPHRPGQTPPELERSLVSLIPQERGSLGALTRAYQSARYSPQAPDEAEVAVAEQAMARIAAAISGTAAPEALPPQDGTPDAPAPAAP